MRLISKLLFGKKKKKHHHKPACSAKPCKSEPVCEPMPKPCIPCDCREPLSEAEQQQERKDE